jgi:hypothetical protein
MYKKLFNEMAMPKEVYTGGIEPFLKEEGKYEVYVKPSDKYLGQYIVTVFRGKSTKPYANYRYTSMEEAGKAVDKFVQAIIADYERKAEYQKEKKQKAKIMFDNIKVGDIFYTSWGYDQTNVEMYQVIEKGEKTVMVAEIAQETVPGTEGFMSSNVRPVPNKFVGEPFRAVVNQYGLKGKEMYYGAWPYDRGEKGTYTSSYA